MLRFLRRIFGCNHDWVQEIRHDTTPNGWPVAYSFNKCIKCGSGQGGGYMYVDQPNGVRNVTVFGAGGDSVNGKGGKGGFASTRKENKK
jgi:hypothetical protein